MIDILNERTITIQNGTLATAITPSIRAVPII